MKRKSINDWAYGMLREADTITTYAQTLILPKSIQNLSPEDLRNFEFRYVDIERVSEAWINSHQPCSDCPLNRREDDINTSDCPAGFDLVDSACPYGWQLQEVYAYCLMAECLLLCTLGDVDD